MKNQTNYQISLKKLTRSLALIAFTVFLSTAFSGCAPKSQGVNSRFGGVQIGTISYSFRSMPTGAEDILSYLLEAGISSVELMGNTIEEFAGAPVYQGPVFRRGEEFTEEQRAEMNEARAKHAEEIREWRLSVSMDRYRELREMYNNAGVNIDISKLGSPNWTDEEIDYAFEVAKTLGARGISFEISIDNAKRMAPFAEKPGQPGFSLEEHLALGSSLMLNFDVGHYWGATGNHPNEIIEKFHDRIVSLHIKDKTGPDEEPRDSNMPFGEGSTPIADILLLLKEQGWPITADIELEYTIPEGSDAVAEVRKCLEYCRAILE
jgi:sugar phosphate isomerase/epimerase